MTDSVIDQEVKENVTGENMKTVENMAEIDK